MGWNDRNPELYEQITGLSYETDLPLDGRRTMPAGWTPPAMPETCSACKATGDTCNDPIYEGECMDCDEPMCRHCGEVEGDEGGNMYWCRTCYDKET